VTVGRRPVVTAIRGLSLTANNLLPPLKTRITIPELNQKPTMITSFFLLCISLYGSTLVTIRREAGRIASFLSLLLLGGRKKEMRCSKRIPSAHACPEICATTDLCQGVGTVPCMKSAAGLLRARLNNDRQEHNIANAREYLIRV
jgi:hypothetical protein